jgi:hypothetical protein
LERWRWHRFAHALVQSRPMREFVAIRDIWDSSLAKLSDYNRVVPQR